MDEAVGIAGRRLQRVGEGMAEIEERAGALVALVGGDGRRLGAAGDRDGVLALRPAGGDRAPVRFEPGEERRIADEAVFGDFGIAGIELPRRQRIENAGIGEDEVGLMEQRRRGSCRARC